MIDRTLAAIAEPTRRRVIDLLRQRPRRAGELAEAVDVSPPLMSRHLRTLRLHGIVEETHGDPGIHGCGCTSCGASRLWSCAAGWTMWRAFWTDQLGAFRDHVEKTRKRK